MFYKLMPDGTIASGPTVLSSTINLNFANRATATPPLNIDGWQWFDDDVSALTKLSVDRQAAFAAALAAARTLTDIAEAAAILQGP